MRSALTIILFTVACFFACSKDYSFEGGMEEPAVIDTSTFYVDMQIDGSRVYYGAGQQGFALYFAGGVLLPGVAQNFICGIDGGPNNAEFEFQKFFLRLNDNDSTEYLREQRGIAFFSPGSYPLANPTAGNGVLLRWVDGNSVEWKTAAVAPNDNSQSFSITESTPVYSGSMLVGIKVKAGFDALFYNTSQQTKRIKGVFVLGVWL